MDKNLIEKLEILKKINTDDSNFILKVFDAYQKNEAQIEQKKQLTTIVISNQYILSEQNIIDLDKIWSKPYFYTKMRLKLNEIVRQLLDTDKNEILSNPIGFCNNAIFSKLSIDFKKDENEIDIVEFIQQLDKNKAKETLLFTFVAKEIDEETLFKEEQLKKAIEIININNTQERNKIIYEEIYDYLTKDFVANNYCDFQNNKCVAQRHFSLYPLNRKNGCCFTRIRTCPNLKNGSCNVECLACRLFSCPYLTKRGISYWANEFVLLKAFYTKKQRKHVVFDFYHSKQKVLKKISKEIGNA